MAVLPTFEWWLDQCELPDFEGATHYDRVNIAWQQSGQAVAQRIAEMREDPVAGANIRILFDVLSEDIIDSHLGRGWFAQHVTRSASNDQTKNYLLQLSGSHSLDADHGPHVSTLRFQHRDHQQ